MRSRPDDAGAAMPATTMNRRGNSMLRYFALALVAGLSSSAAFAQAEPAAASDTILVFDASGSMWGQIDGVAKITTARDVVQGLLKDLPPERRMGLVAYGHRRKGDCSDIQTLVPVGTDRAAIGTAIARLNPMGMTPMTAAVEQAAEALKFTENEATVILVSDGQETCHKDPCQAAASLAKMGIGLTVHTVGFGLGPEEAGAKGELSCIAEATGGRFFIADDARGLRAALEEISAVQAAPPAASAPTPAPAPAPEPPAVATVTVQLYATDQVGGPRIRDGLAWTVRHGATGEVLHEASGVGPVTVELPRGVHDVTVQRLSDGASAEGQISGQTLTLPIVVAMEASVQGPETGAAGATVRVSWTGPDEQGDYVSVAKPEHADTKYETYTNSSRGNPLNVRLPANAGEYEFRYVNQKTRRVLARQPVSVTPVEASVAPPATAAAGATVRVAWTGPDYAADYVSVAKPESADNRYETFTYTSRGNPLELRMPADAGSYEVRYVQAQKHQVIGRAPITVTAVSASLEAPSSAAAGATIRVSWSGPGYADDYVSVAKADAAGNRYERYTYTSRGSPLELRMPAEPGSYELRYVQHQGSRVLARKAITVTAPDSP